MSYFSSDNARFSRARIFASAAVLALVASGAMSEIAWSESTPIRAGPAAAITDSQAQSMPSFAPLIERVRPAVVSVRIKIANIAAEMNDLSGQTGNLPPEIQQFLKRFGDQNGALPRAPSPPMMGEGSGFFISADGYIVTNNHVVQNAKTVTVIMDDGKTLDAKVIGTDPKTDLALLKVNEKGDYPFVSFAKDTPRVGDWVVAIGNPFGLGCTATAGIISAEGRDIGEVPYARFLHIDAPINKGNSGGPTFNLNGEVVGVNTASPSGGSVGVGFAIPASTADSVIVSLEHGGVVNRGYLGVMIQPVSQDIADGLGLKAAAGALVDKAEPRTPAAEAGLKSGDVITKLNGQAVKDAADLTRRVGSLKPGEKVEIAFLRDGAEKTVSLTLAAQKNQQTAMAGAAQNEGALRLGVQLVPANQMAGAGDQGVAIVNVDPDGVAGSKGFTDGDVILDVGGKAVTEPSEVKAEIAAAQHDGKKAVLMRIKTAQGERFVAFEFPKA
jgi:serine protease Do